MKYLKGKLMRNINEWNEGDTIVLLGKLKGERVLVMHYKTEETRTVSSTFIKWENKESLKFDKRRSVSVSV